MMFFIRTCLFAALFLWFPSAFKRWTHAFRLEKCKVFWEYRLDWQTPKADSEVQNILAEPFHYLGKGAQSYVFVSASEKYVLKLFRFNSTKMPYGQNLAIAFRQLLGLRPKHFLPLDIKVPKTFSSCRFAYEQAPHLTGVVWAHLNLGKTDLAPIVVRDRLGIKHRIDPAQYRFVLQRKAQPFCQALKEAKNPIPLIDSYLSLLQELAKIGLANLDPNMGKNFGVIDGKVVEIDFGNFSLDPELAAQDPARFRARLVNWLKQHRPEALSYAEQLLRN